MSAAISVTVTCANASRSIPTGVAFEPSLKVSVMKNMFYVVLVLLGVQLAAGCTPVLVAGAGAAGYYVGKDSRSAGRIADDAAITASVKARLAKDNLTSVIDIDVDTYNGVVTLYGKVPSERALDRAVAVARHTRGVRRVVSKLAVAPPK